MAQALTVLIIDDCQEDREVYRRYLLQDREYNYTILEEESGERGLEICRQLQPDSILLDFLLPDLDGLEFLEQLKQQAPVAMPAVIMLTGYGNEAVAVQAMKWGVQDYLVKGETTAELLLSTIHSAIKTAQLSQQLQRSEERFHTSIENMLDCFGIYSAIRNDRGEISDFRIDYVNAAACEFHQMAKEKQLGKGLCEILPIYRESGLFDEYCQVVETGKPLIKESLLYTSLAFDTRITKMGDGFVASWRDITDKKQAEVALRQSEERYRDLSDERQRLLQLEQSAHAAAEAANNAKDEFIAMVSHDLRSPLNAIMGWAKLLRTQQMDTEKINRALETIERNAKSQATLLEDLLNMSRIIQGKLHLDLVQVNLAAVVVGAMETAYPSAQAKNIHLESIVYQSIPPIKGDWNRLSQVLGNLLSNAIKFTPSGGEVEVKLLSNGSHAEITVSDTGIGINPEFLPHIFERYYQGDRIHKQGGLGLGLAIARHLVELHGGTIQVASPGEGLGSTFTVKLPC